MLNVELGHVVSMIGLNLPSLSMRTKPSVLAQNGDYCLLKVCVY